MITKENNGKWELPGGGLDHGYTPHEDLPREIAEEMGIKVTWIAKHPSYFVINEKILPEDYKPFVNIIYETEVEHLNFKPSDECTEIMFVNNDSASELAVFNNVKSLLDQFDPMLHTN